jgi:AraC-like DNA-binding protein
MNIYKQVELFAAEWLRQQGYKPATFQKAIAMQRLERGQSVQEIIDALVAQRIA